MVVDEEEGGEGWEMGAGFEETGKVQKSGRCPQQDHTTNSQLLATRRTTYALNVVKGNHV